MQLRRKPMAVIAALVLLLAVAVVAVAVVPGAVAPKRKITGGILIYVSLTDAVTGAAACVDAPETCIHEWKSLGGDGCQGDGGYSDIAQGRVVTVYDDSGKVIGTGALGAGSSKDVQGCRLPFVVDGLPLTSGYTIEVGSRGKLHYTQADLDGAKWDLELQIGSTN